MQSHNTEDSITLQYKNISKHKLGFKVLTLVVFDGITLYFKQSKNCGCIDKSTEDINRFSSIFI